VPTVRSCGFGPLRIEFDERVLTPRIWTFAQSRWAAELLADADAGPILELCAGAGHIGLAAAVLADRDLVQVEADRVAAGYATANAAQAGWSARVEVRCGRLETELRPDERFPLVIADPPYLPSEQVARWPEDPVTAIDGGPDGLAITRACLAVAAAHLPVGGPLLLQVAGPAQAAAVAQETTEFDRGAMRVVDDERAILLLRRR
jgi:methylase of polypeptide subunit release factors